MKKNIILAIALALCGMAISVSAQKTDSKTPNFGGSWTLDVKGSTLSGRDASIESETMTVTQTATDFSAARSTKRTAPPANNGGGTGGGGNTAGGGGTGGGGGMGGGGGRGAGGGGGGGPMTYKLGTDTKGETPGAPSLSSKWDGGNLVLSSSRTFTPPNGGDAMTITTKETWSLSSDGKTATVTREGQGRNGPTSSKFVYTKN